MYWLRLDESGKYIGTAAASFVKENAIIWSLENYAAKNGMG